MLGTEGMRRRSSLGRGAGRGGGAGAGAGFGGCGCARATWGGGLGGSGGLQSAMRFLSSASISASSTLSARARASSDEKAALRAGFGSGGGSAAGGASGPSRVASASAGSAGQQAAQQPGGRQQQEQQRQRGRERTRPGNDGARRPQGGQGPRRHGRRFEDGLPRAGCRHRCLRQGRREQRVGRLLLVAPADDDRPVAHQENERIGWRPGGELQGKTDQAHILARAGGGELVA